MTNYAGWTIPNEYPGTDADVGYDEPPKERRFVSLREKRRREKAKKRAKVARSIPYYPSRPLASPFVRTRLQLQMLTSSEWFDQWEIEWFGPLGERFEVFIRGELHDITGKELNPVVLVRRYGV